MGGGTNGNVTMNVGPRRKMWGTWEELVLGGAVLRHGTQDWDVVASELRARTPYPYAFNPEACKAKYEDLRQRYSGCTAWFEELRKRRVAELKRELEKSEDSIGSLESKLESLKAEKINPNQIDYDSSRTESPIPLPKTERIEIIGKETSKDGLSAGSFTQDIRTNWLSDFQIPALESAQEMQRKPEVLGPCDLEKVLGMDKLAETSNEQGGTFRKRRGKRKRKDCNWDAKEGSIGESDNLGSTNFVSCNETSTSGCGQTVRSSSVDFQDEDSCREGSDDLVGIFNSIAENGNASVFRRRLDSQKRARYRKTIRQHMDFDTIRSRIANCSIKSAKELFRDLLLLANNAIVFYSKRTREYKSALSLRGTVMKRYRQHFKDSGNRSSSSILCFSPIYNPPVRPRSIRARPSKLILSAKSPGCLPGPHGYLKLSSADSTPSPQTVTMGKRNDGTPEGFKKLCDDFGTQSVQSSVKAKKSNMLSQGNRKVRNADPNLQLQSPVIVKKGVGRPRKVGGAAKGNRRYKTPLTKERKRACQN